MKRTLSLILVLILALSLCCTSAYAKTKPSKESDVEVDEPTTKPDKPPVVVDEPPVNPPEVEDTTVPQITEEIASGILGNNGNPIPAKELEVIWQKLVNAGEASEELKLHVDGISEDNPMYVFMWDGNQWVLVKTVTSDDFTLDFLGAANVAFVVKKPVAVPADVVTSPKTGESRALAALAFTAIAASAAYVVLRREDK